MDTQQLRDVLKRDLGPAFGGVYPRDVIPELLPHHKAIVVNTDPHDRPGAHWVYLYLSSPTVEYFDSYGLSASRHWEPFGTVPALGKTHWHCASIP